MIKRDELNIIVQHDPNEPSYGDAGDSPSRTGIMALSGSEQDIKLLPRFMSETGLVRHPTQLPWNDSKLTSRDQLVCYAAGCLNNETPTALRIVKQYSFFINKDVLMPDVRNHLRLCAGLPGALLGYLFLNISILYSAIIKPDHELNQLMCMCIVAGPKYVKRLCSIHPDWETNISKYWSGYPFRDQSELGDLFIQKIKSYL